MAIEHGLPDDGTLVATLAEPLIGVLATSNDEQIVRYAVGERAHGETNDDIRTLESALAVIGAWSDLDWDAFSSELDRLRHERR